MMGDCRGKSPRRKNFRPRGWSAVLPFCRLLPAACLPSHGSLYLQALERCFLGWSADQRELQVEVARTLTEPP